MNGVGSLVVGALVGFGLAEVSKAKPENQSPKVDMQRVKTEVDELARKIHHRYEAFQRHQVQEKAVDVK